MLSVFLNVQEGSRYVQEAHGHNFALCLVPLCSTISIPPCRWMATLHLVLEVFSFLLQLGVPSVQTFSLSAIQTHLYHHHPYSFLHSFSRYGPSTHYVLGIGLA